MVFENYSFLLRYYVIVIYYIPIDDFMKKYNILCRGRSLDVFNGEEILIRYCNVNFYATVLFLWSIYIARKRQQNILH